MDKSSIEQIFMFFNCTMSRDIPKMGKILRLYILEILGHPNITLTSVIKQNTPSCKQQIHFCVVEIQPGSRRIAAPLISQWVASMVQRCVTL